MHLMDSDADDEFECDCPVCLMYQQHISGINCVLEQIVAVQHAMQSCNARCSGI